MGIHLIAVAFGGALGSVLRYLLTLGATKLWGHGFPYGTLLVNILGGFAIMAIMTAAIERGGLSQEWRFFLITGILGGLTTFSTFTYETVVMMQEGDFFKGFANIAISLVSVFGAAMVGIVVGKAYGV